MALRKPREETSRDLDDAALKAGVDLPDPAKTTTDELLVEAATLHLRRETLESEVGRIKARMAEIEPLLIERMTAIGQQGASVQGVTIHIRREIWASAKGGMIPAFKTFLKSNKKLGIDPTSLVKESVNGQTLSGLIRELIRGRKDELGKAAIGKKAEELLPPKLLDFVNVSETTKLGFRAS